jgi:hypothetical protein
MVTLTRWHSHARRGPWPRPALDVTNRRHTLDGRSAFATKWRAPFWPQRRLVRVRVCVPRKYTSSCVCFPRFWIPNVCCFHALSDDVAIPERSVIPEDSKTAVNERRSWDPVQNSHKADDDVPTHLRVRAHTHMPQKNNEGGGL